MKGGCLCAAVGGFGVLVLVFSGRPAGAGPVVGGPRGLTVGLQFPPSGIGEKRNQIGIADGKEKA